MLPLLGLLEWLCSMRLVAQNRNLLTHTNWPLHFAQNVVSQRRQQWQIVCTGGFTWFPQCVQHIFNLHSGAYSISTSTDSRIDKYLVCGRTCSYTFCAHVQIAILHFRCEVNVLCFSRRYVSSCGGAVTPRDISHTPTDGDTKKKWNGKAKEETQTDTDDEPQFMEHGCTLTVFCSASSSAFGTRIINQCRLRRRPFIQTTHTTKCSFVGSRYQK